MHNFIVVLTPPEGQNGVFRTFLDFEKTKALQVRLSLKEGTGNGGMGNGEWGTGNGERGTGNL